VDADGCSGTVERLEGDGFLPVVHTTDGQDAWVPVAELVRVTRKVLLLMSPRSCVAVRR
jgi:hypothetical protein